MSTTHAVDFGGIHVRGAWASPGAGVTAELATYTKAGQARIAVLDERDLQRLIAEATTALGQLRAHAQAVRTGATVEAAAAFAPAELTMPIGSCGVDTLHGEHVFDFDGPLTFCRGGDR